ncbi:FAD:protein FMN transferase [bacterium]|nr:FAD:protein FMN transferase [bacterium]
MTCFLFVFLVFMGIVSGGWFWSTPRLVEATQFLMDTSVTIKIFYSDKTKGESLLKKAFDEGVRIEHIMEPLKGSGELWKINASKDVSEWTVGDDLWRVLERSRYFYELSGGAFDPTIAQVKWLWDFEGDGHIPDMRDIQEKLRSVGFSHVELNDHHIRFGNPETRLDLGGVAKGYAVDRMVAVLKENGVKSGLVNAGGDIYYFGKKPGNADWVIGVRHPRLSRTIMIDTMPFPTVATSGDYERFFIKDGVRYHHILDPSNGYPARGCISVTVWAENAMDADILSTTIFVLGPEKGLAFAESLGNVETLIFFEKNGKVEAVMSSGVKDKVNL